MGESPSTLRRDVDDARDRLGDTVEEMAYRATAPKRAAGRIRARLISPVGAAAVAAAVLVAVALVARRRS